MSGALEERGARSFLVFDLDGTLSDPAVGIGRSINYALDAFGYAPVADGALSSYIGPPLDETFARLTGSDSRAHAAELVAKYRERYADVGYAENVLYPGVPEALRHLTDLEIPLGVCTSKRVDFAERILALFGLRPLFEFVSGGEIGVQKHEQLAALIADGVVAARSTMIGDRAVDVHAARANGLRSVGVLWGHGDEPELSAAGAELLLHAPNELARLRPQV